jgi:EAL domain-containing protein (putative c-di-GMP-specific phosphodiesterase class I)
MHRWTQNLQRWWHARRDDGQLRVGAMLEKRSLGLVFQPMVELRSGNVLAHEALIRTPRSVGDLGFGGLMQVAKTQSCQRQLELACLDQAIECWLVERGKGLLFVNISASTLIELDDASAMDTLLEVLRKHKLQPKRLGLDITGYTQGSRTDALVRALVPLRQAGITIALDDFKASDTSMQVWAEVLPQIVKLSPRWTRAVEHDEDNCRALSKLAALTHKHHSALLAKAVESENELRILRDLGVDLAQGYFMGSPAQEPTSSLNLRARAVLAQAPQ